MTTHKPIGKLAYQQLGVRFELRVMRSAQGFYVGTGNELGPVSRESEEYYATSDLAQHALDNSEFTQREHP